MWGAGGFGRPSNIEGLRGHCDVFWERRVADVGVHKGGQQSCGGACVADGGVGASQGCADCPAAVDKASPIEQWEVVLGCLEGAQGR